MDRKAVVHIYNGILLYSAIKMNEFELVLERWMNPEPIIQSELSQKEKNMICKDICTTMFIASLITIAKT